MDEQWWVILYGLTGLKKDISLFLQLDLSKCSGILASDNFLLYFFVVAFLQDLILNLVNDQIFFSIMHFRFFFRQIFTCFFVTWFGSGSFFHMIILGRSFSCLQLDLFLGCSRHAPLLSYLPWLGNFFLLHYFGAVYWLHSLLVPVNCLCRPSYCSYQSFFRINCTGISCYFDICLGYCFLLWVGILGCSYGGQW